MYLVPIFAIAYGVGFSVNVCHVQYFRVIFSVLFLFSLFCFFLVR